MKKEKLPEIELYEPAIIFGDKSWIVLTVCKADIGDNIATVEYLKGKELTDDEMATVARKMADNLMDDYWVALEAAVQYVTDDRK
jgi:hypothetical protein